MQRTIQTRSCHKGLNWIAALVTAAFLTLLFSSPLTAQNSDPPGRVARMRYIQDSVSFEPAGESDWVPAVTNRPVTIGDQL